jgi:two-component system, NtrC family, response regulator HydG
VSGERVLIVDDEPDMVENCARILGRAGHECVTATKAERALELLESMPPDLLLTDLKMPGIDGMELLRRARQLDATLPVIVITAFATIESAVAAIKEGAFDRDLLERHGGNLSAAAKTAGIDRKTFHRLVHKYQIR